MCVSECMCECVCVGMCVCVYVRRGEYMGNAMMYELDR